MVIDMQGQQGSFIDGTTFADTWTPIQDNVFNALTDAGKAIWTHTTQAFTDVYNNVSRMVGIRQNLLNRGVTFDHTQVYYISSFDGMLDARGVMQEYIMAHPTMHQYYQQGIDTYEKWEPRPTRRVMYAWAIEDIVQFEADGTESLTAVWDEENPDLEPLTKEMQTNIHHTYSFLKDHVFPSLEELLLGELTE